MKRADQWADPMAEPWGAQWAAWTAGWWVSEKVLQLAAKRVAVMVCLKAAHWDNLMVDSMAASKVGWWVA